MHLILIRHADAGPRDPVRYPDDDARPLSDRGREEHRLVAKALHRLGLGVDLLLSSPLARARETAAITAEELGPGKNVRLLEELGSQFSVKGLVKVLKEFPPDAVLGAVGHEPNLSEFASAMLTRGTSARIDFKKSAVLGLSFDEQAQPGEGVLLYFLPPKLLREVAG